MSLDPATGLSVLSTAMQAFGSVSQGQSAYASGMADASVSDENARQAELDGALAGEDVRREARQVDGEAIAAMGANGIALGTGSALEALRESAYNAELDVLSQRYQAASAARAYRLDAQAKRRSAKDARTAGYLSAAGAIITGAAGTWERGETRKLQERATAAGANVRAARRPPAPISGMRMPIPFGPADWQRGTGFGPQRGW